MLERTAVWRDAQAIPALIREISAGIDDAAVLGRMCAARRVVVTGNGAAFYAASVLAAAALEHPGPVACVAVPAGLLATHHLRLHSDDLLLIVSSSGELRDVVDRLATGLAAGVALITATPESTLGRQIADKVVIPVRSQDAVTHSQAYVGNVVVVLSLWQQMTDARLGLDLPGLADASTVALQSSPSWAAAAVESLRHPSAGIAFGSGGAWPAALETALLLKEIAGIPVEGLETREAATSGMYALGAGHVALSHPTRNDPSAAEAEAICAARGASIVRIPGAEQLPALAAAVATFPAALALATTLGLRAGREVDHPSWTAAYYATARSH